MSQNQFLLELSRMFNAGKQTNKTVRITLKRYDGRTTRNPRKPSDKLKRKKRQKQPQNEPKEEKMPTEYKCLIRATMGSKKIRAEVSKKDVQFQQSYSNLIRGNIDLTNTSRQQGSCKN